MKENDTKSTKKTAIEIENQRKKAYEYAHFMRQISEPKYFERILNAVESKNETQINAVLDELKVSGPIRDHFMLVVTNQANMMAPGWC
jgi:hypothetical protein